jgi:hypothetical protein
MKKLFVLFAIVALFGCAGTTEQLQEDLKNRPNVCNELKPGESHLCEAAAQAGINLTDLALVARNAVPVALIAKYDEGAERDEAIDKVIAIAKDIDTFLDGEVTGSNLFKYIDLKSRDDKLYALFAYEAVSQLLNSPQMYSVPLTDWDKQAIKNVLQEIVVRLELIRGGE